MINKAEEYLTGTRDTDERLIIEGALEIVKGNNEEGIADIKKAIKARNKNTRVKIFGYMILADVSFNNGDYDEGLQYTYKRTVTRTDMRDFHSMFMLGFDEEQADKNIS